MFRKIVLASVVAAVGLVSPVGLASKTQAGDTRHGHGHHRAHHGHHGHKHHGHHGHHGHQRHVNRYHPPVYHPPVYHPPVYRPPVIEQCYNVYYRDCASSPWKCYGSYRSHSYAHEMIETLEYRGYEARVARR